LKPLLEAKKDELGLKWLEKNTKPL